LTVSPLAPSQDYSTFAGPLDAISVVAEEPIAYVQVPLNIEGLP
jgi:hypothetical protein